MQSGSGTLGVLPPRASATSRTRQLRLVSRVLLILGCALLLAAVVYLAAGRLQMWVEAQDRYLDVDEVASLEITAVPASPTPEPTAAPRPSATPLSEPQEPVVAGPTEVIVALPTATFVSRSMATATPVPTLAPVASPLPPATPAPAVAVRIRIPAIGVDRSIIELQPVLNTKTGAYELPLQSLFRRPGTDLVGHWVGSAVPGQPGNMILVGHNYGYGYNGVFLNVSRLKVGQAISIVSATGEVYGYEVVTVKRVKWSKKNEQELVRHQAYLSLGGEERLTLVTCGGATWEPFPDRVYVVAEPAR